MLENKETGERTEKYSVLSASRQNIPPIMFGIPHGIFKLYMYVFHYLMQKS